jgi:hypothetical protein
LRYIGGFVVSVLNVGFGSGVGGGGYTIGKSLRFRASASARIQRTFGAGGNRRTWTYSTWLKRGSVSSFSWLLVAGTTANDFSRLFITDAGALRFDDFVANVFIAQKISTALLRDPSAHYHIVCAYDSTQATAANRLKLYINGVLVTSFSTSNEVDLNHDSYINSAVLHRIGANSTATFFSDDYQSEIHFVSGQQLDATEFGEIDAITGVWVPKEYTGTHGTTGFYLPFNDGTSLTTLTEDRSGNGNNWTATNISLTAGTTYDWMDDTPTNNFATLNPLIVGASNLANANLTSSGATVAPTIVPGSGTYYLERDESSLTWTPPAAFPASAGNYNFGQRPFSGSPSHPLLNTNSLRPLSTVSSGSFTGNANVNGPFVWLGGTPASMTINGNAVTFGTHADRLANGIKLRTNSASYNAAGSNTFSVASFVDDFTDPNRAKANP